MRYLSKIVILILILTNSIIKAQQEPSAETKAYILSMIQSDDYFDRSKAIGEALFYNVPEVVPILEQTIWQQGRSLAYDYLLALSKYNSPNFISLAHQFMNAVDTIHVENADFIDTLEMKVNITYELFLKGDYSTAENVFELVDRKKPETFRNSSNLLEKIINNLPTYESQAKQELIRIAYLDNWSESYNAINTLVKKYGIETAPILAYAFENFNNRLNDRSIRALALNNLLKFNYPNLDELMRNRLLLDSTMTTEIVRDLFEYYPSIQNYQYVSDHLTQIHNETSRSIVAEFLIVFKQQNLDSLKSTLQLIDELINLVDTVYNDNWLANEELISELQNQLQSAKTNLQNGDSIACVINIKSFQDTVDVVYKDSLNSDPRFITIEGWKFLYYSAQYILDRLPEIPLGSNISTYALFATHSLWLKENSDVLSGDIGVNEAGSAPFLDSQVELSIGIGVTTPVGYSIKATRIKVKQGSTINGDVYYNELDNNGTITGLQNTPLELPIVSTFPEFKSSTPGTIDIVIPIGGEQTLQPGSYGTIQVKKNGKLILRGGEYHINLFNGGINNQIVFQSPSEVRIADKFDSGQGSYIGPEDTTTVSAKDIIFYVGGINGNNGNLGATPKAAKIGISNVIKANFFVPNGTLWIKEHSEIEGSFIAKDIEFGIGAKVKLNSAF